MRILFSFFFPPDHLSSHFVQLKERLVLSINYLKESVVVLIHLLVLLISLITSLDSIIIESQKLIPNYILLDISQVSLSSENFQELLQFRLLLFDSNLNKSSHNNILEDIFSSPDSFLFRLSYFVI